MHQARREESEQGSLGKKTKDGWSRNGHEGLKRKTEGQSARRAARPHQREPNDKH